MKEGWEYKKLGDVAIIINGFAFKSSLFTKEGEKILRISNIQNDIVDLSDVVFFNKETYKQNLDKYKVYPDDILIALSGATTGKIGINKTNETLYLNQRVAICRESVKTLNHKYLYCYLKTKSLEFLKDAEGVAQPNLSTEQMKNYVLPIPPLSEQQHIVEELDLLSSIIEKKKAQLNELDNLAQSLFYEMFGHLYETAFPIKVLIDICEFIKDGTHQTPTYTDDKVNGVKFLSAKDVVSGYINWENVKLIPFELHQELHKRIAPQRNDLLLCKNGTTGICAIVETDEIFDIYVSLALLRPKKPFCPKYLLYAINNPQTKRQFDESLKGIGVPNLHLGEIKKTKIIFPPLELQQQFATKIEAIEHQKEFIKQSIKEVETLFNSRMDYYFN